MVFVFLNVSGMRDHKRTRCARAAKRTWFAAGKPNSAEKMGARNGRLWRQRVAIRRVSSTRQRRFQTEMASVTWSRC